MKLYVGNLPYQATEDQLTDWFAEHGITPDSVSLVRDRFSGEARGAGGFRRQRLRLDARRDHAALGDGEDEAARVRRTGSTDGDLHETGSWEAMEAPEDGGIGAK